MKHKCSQSVSNQRKLHQDTLKLTVQNQRQRENFESSEGKEARHIQWNLHDIWPADITVETAGQDRMG